MYGYQPPPDEPEGSWGETLVMIKVVFQMLAPVLAVLGGAMLLLVLTLVLLFQHPLLALIPLAGIAAGFYWLVRRDRRLHDEEAKRIFGR
jgi:hypothetical protein